SDERAQGGRPAHHRGAQQDRAWHAGASDRGAACRRAATSERATTCGRGAAGRGALIMLARVFANRPVFASVISIVIMLAGLAAIEALAVAQYPDVALPSVSISAGYPGASAETVENSVTQVLEQQLTGVDGLLYFSSASSSAGAANINVTFSKATN